MVLNSHSSILRMMRETTEIAWQPAIRQPLMGRMACLFFEPRQSHTETSDGYADMAWPNVTFEGGAATYYLKETRAPAGCDINDTVIPVKVGVYSIYADAGTPDDNVSVSAGVGKLTQTMVQYASEGDVNITLRDITSFAQSQPSGSFGLQDWEDVYLSDTGSAKVPRSMESALRAERGRGLWSFRRGWRQEYPAVLRDRFGLFDALVSSRTCMHTTIRTTLIIRMQPLMIWAIWISPVYSA